MWTPDPNGHDHVFCRYVASNTEINCDAAEDQYFTDYQDVKNYRYPGIFCRSLVSWPPSHNVTQCIT
jgi:hypothetical protein